jgi:adenylate cyclase
VRATVLFSDLRGFTAHAEKLAPEDLVAQLNDYVGVVVEAIRAEGGVVDKYVGDAVMAVFGVPRPSLSDAQRAVRAAISMQGALALHNVERTKRGLPALRQGIGVHCGTVVAGNVGTTDRASFTVIGDTVNVASRLESASKDLEVDIVISEDAARAAGAGVDEKCPVLVDAGVISVKGRAEPLRVFTPKLD